MIIYLFSCTSLSSMEHVHSTMLRTAARSKQSSESLAVCEEGMIIGDESEWHSFPYNLTRLPR